MEVAVIRLGFIYYEYHGVDILMISKKNIVNLLITSLIGFSSLTSAGEGGTFFCEQLEGAWVATSQSHPYVMNISPSDDYYPDSKVFDVSYNVSSDGNENKLFCYEGIDKVKPMVMAFSNAEGTQQTIATYNNELEMLWSGVFAKNEDDKFIPRVDQYWFKKIL
jgi:hypothetical protein